MLWRMRELEDFSMRARDGVIGTPEELYLSDDTWAVRYLVVAAGDWLERRTVLVSPLALSQPNGPAKVIPVDLTRRQLKEAPSADSEKPVSREFESRYHDHFQWPYYWVGGPMWGPFLTPGELARAQVYESAPAELARERKKMSKHPHLRSSREMTGYSFEGRDGSLGHIEDFIVDDENWTVKYLEIDTRNWWPGGKKVLLPRERIREVSYVDRKVQCEVTREAVKNAPAYDESIPIYPAFEDALTRHYSVDPATAGLS